MWVESILDAIYSAHEHAIHVSVREVLREAASRTIVGKHQTVLDRFNYWRDSLIKERKRLSFDQAKLQWVTHCILAPAVNAKVSYVEDEKDYINLMWQTPKHRCYFGFEAGNHWRRWKAIFSTASKYREVASHEGLVALAVFFRTPELKPLPNSVQTTINENTSYIRIIDLSEEETLDFYAAREFLCLGRTR